MSETCRLRRGEGYGTRSDARQEKVWGRKHPQLAQAAGHTTSAMTLRYYVKGRETDQAATAALEQLYTA